MQRGPNLGLVRTLCLAAGVGGVATLLASVLLSQGTAFNPWLFLAFTTGITVMQVMPLQVSHDPHGGENVHLEEAFLVPMMIAVSAPEAILGVGLSVAFGNVWRRRGFLKTTFNAGMYMVATGIGIVVSRGLGASVDDMSMGSILAASVGVWAFTLILMLAVSGIMSVAQRVSFTQQVFSGGIVRVATWASSIAVGVLIASAMATHPWTLPFTILPISMLELIYSRAFGQYRERRQIEKLYDAAASIRSNMDSRAVLHQLLAASQGLLDAT